MFSLDHWELDVQQDKFKMATKSNNKVAMLLFNVNPLTHFVKDSISHFLTNFDIESL